MMKNKKGQFLSVAAIIVVCIIGAVFLFGNLGALLSGFKIQSILTSIPTWFWFVLIGILFLMLIPKR